LFRHFCSARGEACLAALKAFVPPLDDGAFAALDSRADQTLHATTKVADSRADVRRRILPRRAIAATIPPAPVLAQVAGDAAPPKRVAKPRLKTVDIAYQIQAQSPEQIDRIIKSLSGTDWTAIWTSGEDRDLSRFRSGAEGPLPEVRHHQGPCAAAEGLRVDGDILLSGIPATRGPKTDEILDIFRDMFLKRLRMFRATA